MISCTKNFFRINLWFIIGKCFIFPIHAELYKNYLGKKVSWVELQQKKPDFGTVFLSLLYINALCLDTFLNKEEISSFLNLDL